MGKLLSHFRKKFLVSTLSLVVAIGTLGTGQGAIAAEASATEQYLVASTSIVTAMMNQELINDTRTTKFNVKNRKSTAETVIPLIVSEIEWQSPYSAEVFAEIVTQLTYVPVPILERFYQVGGHIIMVDSLGQAMGYTFSSVDATTDVLVESEIQMENSVYAVRSSLCHEMGHFIYADIWGFQSKYIPLQYSVSSENAVALANAAGEMAHSDGWANNGAYLMSSNEEYFAGEFGYYCRYGANAAYLDLMDLSTIVNIYTNYLTTTKLPK